MNNSNIVSQNLESFLEDWKKEKDRFFFVLMIQNFCHSFYFSKTTMNVIRFEIFNFTMNTSILNNISQNLEGFLWERHIFASIFPSTLTLL